MPLDGTSSRRDRLTWAALLTFVGAATALAHWPALSARAVGFDDEPYFYHNRLVNSPGLASAKQFITEVFSPSTVSGYYQPLTMISLMLDAAAGAAPANPFPLHRTSLALHILNCLLIAGLLHRLFGSAWVAAGVALLFGAHPLTVETIPWVGERKTLLASFFALLCLHAYVRYAAARRAGAPADGPVATRSMAWAYYLAGLAFLLLALLSKPTATPLPLILLLLDAWPMRRLSWRAVWEKTPYFAVAVASAIITFVSQARVSQVRLPSEYPAFHAPLMICHNNIFYLIKFLWPADQTPHYLMPQPLGLSNPWILAGVGGTILLVLVLALTLRRTPAVAVCWLIYFLALLPTMQIVGFTNVAASDKYVYFPSIGLLMLLTYGCVQVLQKVRHRRLGGAVLAVLAIGLATVEARATRTYLAVWRDTESLYRHMIAHAPRAAWLISNLGNELLDQGRVDEAIEIHRRAVALTADQPAIHNDLGNALRAKGLLDEAMAQYRIALGLFPEYAVGHRNLGVALADQGRFAEAVSHLETAAALEPRRAETKACLASAHMNWAISLDRIGRSADALPHFQVAIALNPDDAEARYNLAQALRAHGRPAEAAEHMREALRRNPNDPDAREILDELLREQGNDPSSKAP